MTLDFWLLSSVVNLRFPGSLVKMTTVATFPSKFHKNISFDLFSRIARHLLFILMETRKHSHRKEIMKNSQNHQHFTRPHDHLTVYRSESHKSPFQVSQMLARVPWAVNVVFCGTNQENGWKKNNKMKREKVINVRSIEDARVKAINIEKNSSATFIRCT